MMHCSPSYYSFSKRGTLLAATLLIGLLAFVSKAAWSASSCRNNGNLQVTVSATGINFSSYDVLSSSDTPGNGTISVSATCTHATIPFTVNYSIALSTGGSGSFAPRSMAAGVSKLQYNLYTDASLTTIWGDDTGGTQTVSDQIIGICQNPGGQNCSGSQNDTVYGNIPAMQNVVAGNYTDTIAVTVNF